jgi:hypothetical protein
METPSSRESGNEYNNKNNNGAETRKKRTRKQATISFKADGC